MIIFCQKWSWYAFIIAGLFDIRGTFRTSHSTYRKSSIISHTKSQNLNVSHPTLQLSLPNPLKPSLKSRIPTKVHLILEAWGFLTQCDQYVEYNNDSSLINTVITQVPQGSVLGPYIYMTDIHNVTHNLNYYANDTTLIKVIHKENSRFLSRVFPIPCLYHELNMIIHISTYKSSFM